MDSVYGRSAAGVKARLEHSDLSGWRVQAEAETDDDGCVKEWHDRAFARGLYRIVFDSDRYFVSLGLSAAYPEISVMFRMQEDGGPHEIQIRLQLLLSPHAYSTYFGSHG
ncbi:hydroxyisourate hydrolase [Nonomuraea jiangxiensis]|uniref:hydroxyisourate hydrolase n=1 Tax=Nonomuraea jiangxiensis TaxID=633440 RepID=UPI0015A33128|nr:hydroxyisourate hydrolase [Nonomuraea jiangxiensis]